LDYPGEWLLVLELLDRTFGAWSDRVLERLAGRDEAAAYRGAVPGADLPFDESTARQLATAFTHYLKAARASGYSDCTPGRFLLPGELEGSPALTFAPIPRPDRPSRRGLWREMERRFEAYKRSVVKPFFRDHFTRIDRQIVLVDVLGALHGGPGATEDLRRAMADILGAFRPGRNGFLSELLLGKRVERILFAATKADHLHQSQHQRLSAITAALLKDAKTRADFAGATTEAMAIAALRATTEEIRDHEGAPLGLVRGQLTDGRQAAFYPGPLPTDPMHILGPARDGATDWRGTDYQAMSFAPAPLTLKPGEGPPHIRLDRAAQFLIGDRL